MKSILVVEPNLHLAQNLISIFDPQNYSIHLTHTLTNALFYAKNHTHDLVIVDRELSDGDGLKLIEFLHLHAFQTKTLVLSKFNSIHDRVEGLAAGADEYLQKPPNLREFKLRVNKLLGKQKVFDYKTLKAGPLILYPEDNLLLIPQSKTHDQNFDKIILRKKECEILTCLIAHKNHIVSRKKLIEWAWAGEKEPYYNTVDVHMGRLRLLLKDYPQIIQTVRGMGYVFKIKDK